MESVGRMTRSRAKALGATPMAAFPEKTPDLKTTGRRRGGKAAAQAAQQEPKVPEQKSLADAFDTVPSQKEAKESTDLQPEMSSDLVLERSLDQLPQPASDPQLAELHEDADGPLDAQDRPLMASPIMLGNRALVSAAEPETITPVPLTFDEPADNEPANKDLPEAATPEGVHEPEPSSPTPAPKEEPATMASPVPMATPEPVGAIGMQPIPALSPIPEPMEASPLPAFQLPAPHAGGADNQPSPFPAAMPMDASPLPAGTPMSFISDMPNGEAAQAQAAPSPMAMAASMPGTPLSFTSSAMMDAVDEANFSPMPDDDYLEGSTSPSADSPAVSLADGAILTPMAQPPAHEDADMADATPGAEMLINVPAATPASFMSDAMHGSHFPAAEPSPIAALAFNAPDSVPHAAAAFRAPAASIGFQGFTPGLQAAVDQLESPSLGGLTPLPTNYDTATTAEVTPILCPAFDEAKINTPMAISPLVVGGILQAPAPTPEYDAGAGPQWALSSTPIMTAVASLSQPMAQAADVADAAMEEGAQSAALEATEPNAAAAAEPNAAVDTTVGQEASEPQQPMPSPAPFTKTPSGTRSTPKSAVLAGRSPAAFSGVRTGVATSKPVGTKSVTTTKPTTPGAGSTPKMCNSYVHVESRYNKTPKAAAPVAVAAEATSTPVAPTNPAAGAKSAKRVSIHTPEGPRSTVPQRQVVPTPFRPKSAVRSSAPPSAKEGNAEEAAPEAVPVEAMAPEAAGPAPAPEPSVAAEDRRSKAAERLQAIHAAEQGVAGSSVPGYLAKTQSFSGKSTKVMQSKVEAPSSYDPRSIRQLKREIKEIAEKKQGKGTASGLMEARNTKLTPKVEERELPMPDQDDSDEEAEYDESHETELATAMDGLKVAPAKGPVVPLRGLPAPQGRHLRFDDKGKTSESPKRVVLRGTAAPVGRYKRFE